MTPLSFLVLTDHRGHTNQNSVYTLVSTLVRDPRCAYVDVASRGHSENDCFFKNCGAPSPQANGAGGQVRGFRVNGELRYSPGGGQFTESTVLLDPAAYDVIWLRLPHPVNIQALEKLSRPTANVVVNDPVGIRKTGDKSFLLNFPELTPPVRLVGTAAEVRGFAQNFPLVLKPLRAYGGQGILRIEGPNDVPDLDFSEPYLAMKFLRNVSEGDKRILVVNGKIMAASLRLPAPGGWLCNVAQGGASIAAEVDRTELALVESLAPALRRHNICFAGVDTLVDDDGKRVLSEINTLSIGGFPQAEAQTGRPILQQTIDELFSYCYEHLQ